MAKRSPDTHVSQAEVEGAIAGYFGVAATAQGIGELARAVFPGVQQASKQNPAGWRSVIPHVLANHVSMAHSLGVTGSALQQQLDIMRHSNRTSADFVHALARVQSLVAGMGGWSRVAAAIEGGGDGSRSPSSMARTIEMTGGPFTATNLSSGMRGHTMGGRFSTQDVASAGNYLSSLGMTTDEVHRHAGYFVGSSDTVRHAIRDHIRKGEMLTDSHVTNMNDARAIMGAIKAGKIKPESAPPSVQKLMEQMKQQGVDPATADPKKIQEYFEKNPQALDAAKKANADSITSQQGMTREQVTSQMEATPTKPTSQAGSPVTPAPAKQNAQQPTSKDAPTASKTVKLSLG